jgi:hypothetical protein
MTRLRRAPIPVQHFIHRIGFRGYFLATLAIVDVFQGLNFVQPGSAGQVVTNSYLADAIPFHWGFLAGIIIKVAYVVSLIYGTMHGMPDGPRRVVIWMWILTAVWVMSRLPEPPWDLIEMNEDIERSGEIHLPPHREGGEDA